MRQEERREETTISDPDSHKIIRKIETTSPHPSDGHTQGDYQAKKAIFRTYQIIWYILGLIEVLLAFRFILLLLGANAQSGFVNFIYTLSSPFSAPFAGIFGVTNESGVVFEWTTLVAMAVYALVAYGIVSMFQIVKPTNPGEVESVVDNQ